MKRFAIVEHHVNDQSIKVEDQKIIGQQPVHDLVSAYHWFRLDDAHIMLLADYSVSKHAELHSHDKASMLAHVNSNRPIYAHIQKNVIHQNKDKHWNALKDYLGLDENTSMEDMIDIVVAKHGAIYAVAT